MIQKKAVLFVVVLFSATLICSNVVSATMNKSGDSNVEQLITDPKATSPELSTVARQKEVEIVVVQGNSKRMQYLNRDKKVYVVGSMILLGLLVFGIGRYIRREHYKPRSGYRRL